MWAMIATSIALGVWTAGLLWYTIRSERERDVDGLESVGIGEDVTNGNTKVT